MMSLHDQSKICFKCGGKCCKWKYARFSANFDEDTDHYQKTRGADHVDTPVGRIYFDKLSCQHLDEKSMCSIYNDRPKVCKEFPFSKTGSLIRSLDAWQYLCPLYAHVAKENKTNGLRIL